VLVEDSEWKAFFLPRGSFKSTIITQSFPMWRLCQNPNYRILIDSIKIERSQFFLSEIKQQCEKNARFKELFGEWKNVPGWTEKSITLAHRTTTAREPSIMCAGINAPVTGGHYDLIIVDDLHDETNSYTETGCEKARQHLQSLMPILEPKTAHGLKPPQFIVVGTRWNNIDAYQWLLDTQRIVAR